MDGVKPVCSYSKSGSRPICELEDLEECTVAKVVRDHLKSLYFVLADGRVIRLGICPDDDTWTRVIDLHVSGIADFVGHTIMSITREFAVELPPVAGRNVDYDEISIFYFYTDISTTLCIDMRHGTGDVQLIIPYEVIDEKKKEAIKKLPMLGDF